MRFLAVVFAVLFWAGNVHAQGNQCRTAPNGTSSGYCASEAFITNHFPSSSTPGHVATFADSSGQLLQDGGAATGTVSNIATGQGLTGGPITTTGTLSIVAGIIANVLNLQTGNYSLATGDCNKTVSWSGGAGTLTLPAVAGFAATCAIAICNTNANDNSHHAASLSGFPAPSLGRLWMGQCQAVWIVNGAWEIMIWPGKWRPGFVPALFVDNGGSDANDGLVSNASTSALKNPQTCWTIFQTEWDLGTVQPKCFPTGGQTFTGGVNCSSAGTPNVYFLVGNGGLATIQNTAGSVVIVENDFCGYIIADNINADCTNAHAHPCYAWYNHQQVGTDFSIAPNVAGNTLTGADSSDIAFYCDSVCKVNSAAPVTLAGTFLQGFVLDLGSMGNFSSGVSTAASTGIGGNVFQILGGSHFTFSGALNAGAGTAAAQIFNVQGNGSEVCIGTLSTSGTFTGARQWAALNQGLLLNQSATAIPGSAGITAAGGYLNGAVIGTSAAGC